MSLGLSLTPNETHTTDRFALDVGDWQVDPVSLRLRRGSEERKLEPMAMRLLVFLAGRPAEVISRAEILEEVWEGRAVVDETLSRAMSLVRQALGDSTQESRYIETLPRRGYRLIAAVGRHDPRPADSATTPETTETPETKNGSARTVPTRWRVSAALAVLLGLLVFWLVGRNAERSTPDAVETPRRPGIAVLPFESLSPDPANAYLATGLTEELIHQLAGVSGLRVVSRASSMGFSDSDALAPEIADTLGVDYLLEGTVLAVGQRLRITVQLIRPDRDEHLLSRSYDRAFSEILDLQREVAKDVVEHTRTELSPTEATRLTRDYPISSEAYRAYLQGHQMVRQRNELARGLDLLARSVELAPGFVPAWAALADAHLLSNGYLGRSEDSAYAGAETAIRSALELDPDFAPAHTALGLLRLQRDRDWAGAEASYRRAIELERSDVTARQWYSELLSLIGRHEEALDQIGVALELDPLSPLVHAAVGQRLNAAGRFEEALGRFQDAEALGAEFRWILRERAWALERLGRHQDALAQLVLAATKRNQGANEGQLAVLDRMTKRSGREGYFRWELQRLRSMGRQPPGFPTWIAAAYSGAGQKREAYEWLGKAARARDLWLVHSLKNPAFDLIRDEPRFLEMLGDIPPWRPSPSAD